MKKTVAVEFEEQSKSVVANVKIQYEMDSAEGIVHTEDVLAETKKLFDEAWAYANAKSINKSGVHYK